MADEIKKIFYKETGLFVIDRKQLSDAANKTSIINQLYVDAYNEFKGASNNPQYKDLSHSDRIKKLNEFATNWLKDKGLQ